MDQRTNNQYSTTMFQACSRNGFSSLLILTILFLSLVRNLRLASVMFPLDHCHSGALLIDDSTSSAPYVQQGATGDEYDLMLSVPFYVYEEFGTWLETGTKGRQTFQEVIQYRPKKHKEDLYFYQAALRHPLRTRQPEEAKLFVVPFLSSIVVHSLTHLHRDNRTLCINKTTCGKDILLYLDRFLGESKWFQRHQGRDHIVTATYFGFHHPSIYNEKKDKQQYKNLEKCNVIQWGEENKLNQADRLAFKTFYAGTKCPLSSIKTSDLAMVASLKPGNPKFKDRRNACEWIKKDTNYSMPICGAGKQCPALADARFGLHMRGDTYGANRLLDTLLSGTVPIFTYQQQFDLMPRWIDWNQLSYFAPVTNKTSFLSSLNNILADKEVSERKLHNVLKNNDLFDWETPVPFDTYMYMLQAYLWPALRRNESRYSALVLPPVLSPNSGRLNH